MLANPQTRLWLLAAAVLASLSLGACGNMTDRTRSMLYAVTPYKVEVVQGNFVSKEQVDALKPGMSRQQVREILGTSLLTDVFHADRWDYVFTIRRQGVPDQKRNITVFFENDVVARFDTAELPSENEFVASIAKPLDRKDPPANLTPEQIAKLPEPAQTQSGAQTPQGAVRSYPPLESGTR